MTFGELKARYLAIVEERLAFKEAALRYCNHSKKHERLWKEVQELRKTVEWARSIQEDDTE